MTIERRIPGNLLCFLLLCLMFSFDSWASRIRYGELDYVKTVDPITCTDMVSQRLCELITTDF